MRHSRSFINFAKFFCVAFACLALASCKGRTMENVEPTGDTIEVVIAKDTLNVNNN